MENVKRQKANKNCDGLKVGLSLEKQQSHRSTIDIKCQLLGSDCHSLNRLIITTEFFKVKTFKVDKGLAMFFPFLKQNSLQDNAILLHSTFIVLY